MSSWSSPVMLVPQPDGRSGSVSITGRSLVDTVYALKDEVLELKQENKKMKRSLEEEQRARKELEKLDVNLAG
ncbi:hypothetical protein scyTo_0019297, partial [Scyliorhinus torazame]|nr:hypothetical protein [Scyliorhinus torazame]